VCALLYYWANKCSMKFVRKCHSLHGWVSTIEVAHVRVTLGCEIDTLTANNITHSSLSPRSDTLRAGNYCISNVIIDLAHANMSRLSIHMRRDSREIMSLSWAIMRLQASSRNSARENFYGYQCMRENGEQTKNARTTMEVRWEKAYLTWCDSQVPGISSASLLINFHLNYSGEN